jgi:hypothetical protein
MIKLPPHRVTLVPRILGPIKSFIDPKNTSTIDHKGRAV